MFVFGSGNVIAKANGTTGQASIFGTLQEISLDVDISTVSLRGQSKFPDAIAQAEAKVSGKAKIGQFNINVPTLLTGTTVATGGLLMNYNEAGTIPTTPFTITVTNAATFSQDNGVVFASTGLPLTPVASGPVAGQYSVNTATGVYTFAAADTGKAVLISYNYTVTTGHKTAIAQSLMGNQTTFSLDLLGQYTAYGVTNKMMLHLNSCVAGKFTFPLKNTNFMVHDFEFEAFADASGNVMTWTTTE